MWITTFKTGTHKDMAGKFRTFTRENLDTIVSKFDPAVRKAPACKGHPKIDSPAEGWFDQVKREGDFLRMHLGQVDPVFAEDVKKGRFKYVSLALKPDMSIRHVGFLGGHAPAIDGLGEVAFAAPEADLSCFAFAEYNASRIQRLFRSLREHLIAKHGQEEADSRIPQWELDMLDEDQSSFAAPAADVITPETDMEKTAEQLKAENAQLLADNARLKGEAQTSATQLTAMQFASAREADKVFLQGLGSRVLPKRQSSALDIMGILRGHGEFAFAEGGNKPAVEEFKAILNDMPEQLSFGEQATHDNAGAAQADDAGPASKKIKQAVQEKIDKNPNLTFGQASRLVFAEQPELAKAYTLELQA